MKFWYDTQYSLILSPTAKVIPRLIYVQNKSSSFLNWGHGITQNFPKAGTQVVL